MDRALETMCLFFFRGVPAVVDFAAMRDAVKRLGGDPGKINPLCPADLVIDHSVQVDVSRRYLDYTATENKDNRFFLNELQWKLS